MGAPVALAEVECYPQVDPADVARAYAIGMLLGYGLPKQVFCTGEKRWNEGKGPHTYGNNKLAFYWGNKDPQADPDSPYLLIYAGHSDYIPDFELMMPYAADWGSVSIPRAVVDALIHHGKPVAELKKYQKISTPLYLFELNDGTFFKVNFKGQALPV